MFTHPIRLQFTKYGETFRSNKIGKEGRVWWHMPVIPALWEAEVGRSLEVRSSRPAWPTRQNPVFTEKYKNEPGIVVHGCSPSYLGG